MRRKTHEEYVAEVAVINPNIEVVEEYVNSRTKSLHRCKIDGYEWCVKPNVILRGHGCPVCAGNIKRTHEEYLISVAKINPNIEIVGRYINSHIKTLHKCRIDGHEWYARPYDILKGCGCSKCGDVNSAQKRTMTHKEYVDRVNDISFNIEVIGEYVNALTPIMHRCKIDGYEWNTKPSIILLGCGCPRCSTSKGEKLIAGWLDKQNIFFRQQKTFDDCRDKRVLPFDFYLPEYHVAIEYNGKQHYEPIEYFGGKESFERTVKHDKIKADYCNKNNISLITIPYYADINEELEKMFELVIDKEVVA